MWSTHERRSGTQLGHDKRDITAFDTVFIHSNLSSLPQKYTVKWYSNRQNSIKLWAKNIKRAFNNTLLVAYEERRFLSVGREEILIAINCTRSAEVALVPVLLSITHWTKSGLLVSPPSLFTPWSEWRVMASVLSREPVCRKENCSLIVIGTLHRVIVSITNTKKFWLIESVWKLDVLFAFPTSKKPLESSEHFVFVFKAFVVF